MLLRDMIMSIERNEDLIDCHLNEAIQEGAWVRVQWEGGGLHSKDLHKGGWFHRDLRERRDRGSRGCDGKVPSLIFSNEGRPCIWGEAGGWGHRLGGHGLDTRGKDNRKSGYMHVNWPINL